MMVVILSTVARSIVLLALAALTVWLLRRRPAAARSLILSGALAGVLLLPVLAVVAPVVPVPVLSRDAVPAMRSVEALRPMAASVSHGVGVGGSVGREGVAVGGSAQRAGAVRPAARAAAVEVSSEAPDQPAAGASAATIFGGIWLLGTCVFLARLASSHLAVARLVRSSRDDAGVAWTATVASVRAEMGLRRAVGIRVSADLSVPIVAGLGEPVLVIPERGQTWPPGVRRDVARHELAHVVRWDGVTQLVDRLACAVHWYNPLVWLAASRAAALREHACDDAVLCAGSRASDYAARLLDLVRGDRHGAKGAALAMARPSRIRSRIVSVLDPTRARQAPGARSATSILAATFLAAAVVGALQPTARAAGSPRLPDAPAVSIGVNATPPQAPGAPAPFCTEDLRQSSTSTSSDGDHYSWRVQIRGPGCSIELEADGRVEFNDTFTDLASLSEGARFRFAVLADGVQRVLDIRGESGRLVRQFQIDGVERPWDDAARAWFAEMLIHLDRRTAVGVDVRLPRLLDQGGVDAVLAETALMLGDHARGRYYVALLESTALSADDRRRLLEQAADLTRSDHYAAQVLAAVIGQGRLDDPAERDAAVTMIERIRSDHYRAETITSLTRGPLDAGQLTALLRVVAGMSSDHYKAEVLRALLQSSDLDAASRAVAIEAATSVQSDHYAAEVLGLVVERGVAGRDERDAFLAAAAAVGSDHYRQNVLVAWLGIADLAEADLLAMIDVAAGIGGDHYRAETLIQAVRHPSATERVRERVRQEAAGLSRAYRQRVLEAVG